MGDFYNPYVFVPAVDPDGVGNRAGTYKADLPNGNPLGQGRPAGHDRYQAGHWSGRIGITIEAVTPLLIPDALSERSASSGADKTHKVFRTRRDLRFGDDRPLLPVTAFKGPLRAAYEAITNSRFGVFRGHDAPLARRMAAEESLQLIPGRIVNASSGDGLEVELLMGTTSGYPAWDAKDGWKIPGHAYAAWLPFRRPTHLARPASLTHGDLVTVRLQEVTRLARDKRPPIKLWEVVALSIGNTGSGSLPSSATAQPTTDYRPVHGAYSPSATAALVGYVCWNNHNIKGKHDERVFFTSSPTPPRLDVPRTVINSWRDLILDYKAVYQRDGWNHHGTHPSRHLLEPNSEILKADTLCYVKLKRDDRHNNRPLIKDAKGQHVVEALYPVMIGRELGNWSPIEMLPRKLRPATRIDELSPADRVFGWVRVRDEGTDSTDAPSKIEAPSAWKGQLRIAPIRCEATKDAIEAVPGGGELPLAILSAPKPSQARFYASPDKTGAPFKNGNESDIRTEGYFEKRSAPPARPNSGLRGRKVYLHHRAACDEAVFKEYWSLADACNDATQRDAHAVGPDGKLYREYVRRAGQTGQPKQDSQNRSASDWIRPGTRFSTHIDVMNLNTAELGALLWLLDLGRTDGNKLSAHLRLGGGKPLGFGSVRVQITSLDLAKAKAKREEYASLFGLSKPYRDEQEVAGLRLTGAAGDVQGKLALQGGPVAIFKDVVEYAYGGKQQGSFERVPAIAAFLNAARGFESKPVHYPRGSARPDPEGENYRWFVANQRRPQGPQLSLPDISTADADPGLPFLPRQQRPR